MNEQTVTLSESRRSLLAALGRIPRIIDGALTTKRRRRPDGTWAVYHQLQRWRKGRNETRHVPEEKVAAVRGGIEGARHAHEVLGQLARLDEEALWAGMADDSKKKSTRP